MKPAATCPSRQQLEQLRRGQLPMERVEELARHLEHCDTCVRTFQALKGEDRLVEVLRHQAQVRGVAEDATVRQLIKRLRGLRGQPSEDSASEAETLAPDAEAAEAVRTLLAPPQQPDEIGRLGQYRVLKLLGAGGMGVVYLAEDPQLRRPVALKVMKPAQAASAAARKRFVREAQAAAAIKHDHIVTIYQVGEDRGMPYLAMEFLEGASLDTWLQRGHRPDLRLVLRLGREIAAGLDAAHRRGLIHRDIKPANIWLEAPRGRVKILDFGLARPAGAGTELTQEGAIVGTPAYMAPEQTSGAQLDARCDLFSLGSVLYRLCTGRQPFRGNSTIDLLVAVCTQAPVPVRELNPAIPPGLANLIERLLAKNPAGRPASARDVINILTALERERAAAPTMDAPAPRPAPRRRWPWVAAAVATAVVVVLGVALLAGQIILRITDSQGNVTDVPLKPGHKIELLQKPPAGAGAKAGTDAEAKWPRIVASLAAEQQVAAVMKKLQDSNPGFDGRETHKIEGTAVTELAFCTDQVTDIRPLRALTGLRTLLCAGSDPQRGRLKDLSPLRDLPLTTLALENNPAADLDSVRDLPLQTLRLAATKVADLSVLRLWPLLEVRGDFDSDAAVAVLRSLWNLETINDQPALDFWIKRDPRHAALLQWIAQTRKLPAKERTDVVLSKMKERNPDFDGKWKPGFRNGELTDLTFNTDHVTDVTALRALPRLQKLSCYGKNARTGKLADLAPLQGLPLTYLICRDNPVKDLAPLRHLPLKELDISQSHVNSLELLRGLRLTKLTCYYCWAKLDLEPLRGMPLRHLNVSGNQVGSLEPLRNMPLDRLEIMQTRVTDLTPLEGMPLTYLECRLMRAPNLTPLRKTMLRQIECDNPERQAAALALIWTLDRINGKPRLEFYGAHHPAQAALLQWIADTRLLPTEEQAAAVKAKLKDRNSGLEINRIEIQMSNGKVVGLSLPAAEVTDLAPVRALPDLRLLSCTGTLEKRGRLTDLGPLADLKQLNQLSIAHTAVPDLLALRSLRLAFLDCQGTAVRDLSPLKNLPLQELGCDPELARSNSATLRAVKTLLTINHRPQAEFWKERQAP
jgi:predicted Ser/Thr protein kinase